MALYAAIFILLLVTTCNGINYMNEYCGGQTYVGNAGEDYSYPHLHCGSDFIVLSLQHGVHEYDLHSDCGQVKKILFNSSYYYGTANDPAAITSVLNKLPC